MFYCCLWAVVPHWRDNEKCKTIQRLPKPTPSTKIQRVIGIGDCCILYLNKNWNAKLSTKKKREKAYMIPCPSKELNATPPTFPNGHLQRKMRWGIPRPRQRNEMQRRLTFAESLPLSVKKHRAISSKWFTGTLDQKLNKRQRRYWYPLPQQINKMQTVYPPADPVPSTKKGRICSHENKYYDTSSNCRRDRSPNKTKTKTKTKTKEIDEPMISQRPAQKGNFPLIKKKRSYHAEATTWQQPIDSPAAAFTLFGQNWQV